jgi:hypothetical protein
MIRKLLFVSLLVPCVQARAQQASAVDSAAAQEQQVEVPRSAVDFYAGLRSNGGTDFMIGMKYSRRQPEWKAFGGAGFIEIVFADDTEFLLGGLFQFYPTRKLLLETGPGIAFDGGTDFFWRIGGEYVLGGRALTLIPKAYFDFIHGTTVFGYGLAIGFGGR